jgi:hypothetical protein
MLRSIGCSSGEKRFERPAELAARDLDASMGESSTPVVGELAVAIQA